MKQLAALLMILATMVAGAAQAQTEASTEKHALARELIEISGSLKVAANILDALLPPLLDNVKRNNPRVSDATIDELRRVALEEYKASLPELVDPVATIYESNFSENELKQLIEFYKSPIGTKLVEKNPGIARQSFAIGTVWGKKVGEAVANRIKAEASKKGLAI